MNLSVVRPLVAILLAIPLFGQLSPQQISALDRTAQSAQRDAVIPGLSVAVLSGNGPIWAGAWGYADLENQTLERPESVHRIASISKPFTAVAALLLVEEGRLDLDAPIQTYLPSFPKKQWPLTMRQLLGHLGGIRHYRPDYSDQNSTRHYWSVAEGLEMFAYDPLEHQPGTRYLYSSYGFNLAGAVVERIAQMPFDQFVRDRILAPCGMHSMQPDDVYRIIPHRVRGYRKRANGTIENCALADTSNKIPGGGWVSSASDLVRFASVLMEGRILKQETLNQMWTPQKLQSGKSTGYGMGWSVDQTGSRLVVSHGGGQQGASTYLLLVPSKRIAIAVLSNLENSGVAAIAQQLLRVVEEPGL